MKNPRRILRSCSLLLSLLGLLVLAPPASSQIIIIRTIIIWGGGGGGGGGVPVIVRSHGPEAVNDLAVQGSYAFLATGQRGLQVVDLTDPAAPVRRGLRDTPGYLRSVVLDGDHAYAADETGGLEIINISNPDEPTRLGGLIPSVNGAAQSVFTIVLSGPYAYLGCASGEVIVVDVSDPAAPVQVGHFRPPGAREIQTIFVRLNYLYLVAPEAGFQVFDLSIPTNAVLVGAWETNGGTFPGLAIRGDYAYLTTNNGLQVLTLTNLAEPSACGFTNLPGSPYGVTVSGDYAYVAAGPDGLLILDLTEPCNPRLVGQVKTHGFALAVRLHGHYAVVADDLGGMTVVDVTDPAAPVLVGETGFHSDLLLTELGAPASTGRASLLTVTNTVANHGIGTGPPSWVHFYLSHDPAVSSDDTLLGQRWVPALASAASHRDTTPRAPARQHRTGLALPAGRGGRAGTNHRRG